MENGRLLLECSFYRGNFSGRMSTSHMVSCLQPPKCSSVLSAAAAAKAFFIPSAKQQKCTVETRLDSACKLVCAIVQATAQSRKLAGDWCLDGFHKRLNG